MAVIIFLIEAQARARVTSICDEMKNEHVFMILIINHHTSHHHQHSQQQSIFQWKFKYQDLIVYLHQRIRHADNCCRKGAIFPANIPSSCFCCCSFKKIIIVFEDDAFFKCFLTLLLFLKNSFSTFFSESDAFPEICPLGEIDAFPEICLGPRRSAKPFHFQSAIHIIFEHVSK